jgi:hypothetical protein
MMGSGVLLRLSFFIRIPTSCDCFATRTTPYLIISLSHNLLTSLSRHLIIPLPPSPHPHHPFFTTHVSDWFANRTNMPTIWSNSL